MCEVDYMPTPTDVVVIAKNPRLRDGKDIRSMQANVTTVIYPMSRMNFIEIIPTDDEEKVISFVRE
jgi:hypothetical protein